MRSSAQLVQQYLDEIIAVEQAFEGQLREGAASSGDDSDVQRAFAHSADETHSHFERLSQRRGFLGGATDGIPDGERLLRLVPQIAQPGDIAEERLVQNLLNAYTVSTGAVALYEALALAARSVADGETEILARDIQGEERRTADKIWHFFPSRSKIAFNMLTISEIDPSVETKTIDDRISGS